MDTPQLKASWKGVVSVLKWQVEECFHIILTRMGRVFASKEKRAS